MRIHRRAARALSLAAMLLAATAATAVRPFAADVTISGRVLDDGGEGIGAAQVYVEELGIGDLTGADGAYTLVVPRDALAGERITLVAERTGYARATAVLDVRTDLAADRVERDFHLAASSVRLEELVVTGPGARPGARGRPVEPNPAEAPRDAVRVYDAPAAPPRFAPAPRLEQDRHGWSHDEWGGVGREQYADREDNRFRSAREHPLSTFSIDVDRASYSNVRRFLLGEHRLPPPDAVQIEEMINYFAYDYEMPDGEHPVAVTTELGRAPWNEESLLLRVGLASRPVELDDMPPSNLVFLIDVSGSMATEDKLPLVKRSLELLVERLRPQDRVAIVTYAGAAGLALEPTSGARKREILRAIDRLEAGGSTAGGAGLRLAYDVARRHFQREGNNRVILATDGDFNVGESSDEAMVRLVEERRRQGTYLTVLGFGTGNLQFEKMQLLAQHGNGNHAYIDSLEEARRVLVAEMGGTLLTVAKDVKVQIEFNPAEVRAYRLVGYENRLLASEDFDDDRVDAGELGAGHRVTALYEIVPAGAEGPSGVELRYRDARPSGRSAHEGELAFVRVRYKRPGESESRLLERPVAARVGRPSADFQLASAVAGFGMLLRGSEHRGDLSARRVLALAEEGLGRDPTGERRELIEMIEAYRVLTEGRCAADRESRGSRSGSGVASGGAGAAPLPFSDRCPAPRPPEVRMTPMLTPDATKGLTTVLRELLHGPGRAGYVLNRGDAGLLASLDRLPAAAASARHAGGASIAAHAEHLRYGLSLMNRWAAGENPFPDADWTRAWEMTQVDERAWAERRAALRAEADRWLESLAEPREMGDIEIAGVIGSVVHVAYHLGAMRQMDRSIRGPAATD